MTREDRINYLISKGCTQEKAESIVNTVDNAKPAEIQRMTLNAREESIILNYIGTQPIGGCMRLAEFPIFYSLAIGETYTGDKVQARRIKVDQLDQVTVWRI